jgi:hypothetical protein
MTGPLDALKGKLKPCFVFYRNFPACLPVSLRNLNDPPFQFQRIDRWEPHWMMHGRVLCSLPFVADDVPPGKAHGCENVICMASSEAVNQGSFSSVAN